MLKRESMKPRSSPRVSADLRSSGVVEEIVMIRKSIMIKGELSASEDLMLYGQMEGTIAVPDHTLSIGPHANIGASISARAVVIMGTVTGNVTARERIEIRATGSVTGDIATSGLVVAEGGRLNGRVDMRLK